MNKEENKEKVLTIETPTTLIVTDPCYIVPHHLWEKCEYGGDLSKVGYQVVISDVTRVGDWDCEIWEYSANGEPIDPAGEFTADSGMVCVVAKAEIEQVYPDFFRKTRPMCWTQVDYFVGVVTMRPSIGANYTLVRLLQTDGRFWVNHLIIPY